MLHTTSFLSRFPLLILRIKVYESRNNTFVLFQMWQRVVIIQLKLFLSTEPNWPKQFLDQHKSAQRHTHTKQQRQPIYNHSQLSFVISSTQFHANRDCCVETHTNSHSANVIQMHSKQIFCADYFLFVRMCHTRAVLLLMLLFGRLFWHVFFSFAVSHSSFFMSHTKNFNKSACANGPPSPFRSLCPPWYAYLKFS